MIQGGADFAILMASGFSRRFGGQNKLLIPFRGKPLARHTLDLVCGMDYFDGIFFVTADERVAALAAGLSVVPVPNRAPEKGRRESVRLGIEAAAAILAREGPEKAAHARYLFFPCDQPLLDAETVNRILETAGKTEPKSPRIVEPCFQGKPGNPCLFSAHFRRELISLGENESPRIVKARHPEALIRVEVSGPLALADIDFSETVEQLEKAST